MVEIQCPHCEKDIELEDDSFGLFDCPYCDEEIEYESSSDNGEISRMAKVKSLLSDSTPKQRFFSFFFILGANYFGTLMGEGWFLEIWSISFLADVVFILTMTISFLLVWKLAESAKRKTFYFLIPLITPMLVFIGYTISWFFISLHAAGPNSFLEFMSPIWDPDFDIMFLVLFGWPGLIFTTIYTAIVVFTNTDTPKSVEK